MKNINSNKNNSTSRDALIIGIFIRRRIFQLYKVGVILLMTLALGACNKPDFIKRLPGTKSTDQSNATMAQLTPRELLTARLINPPADENMPRITVGKLIEFADRYLSCDCSGTRFVQSWERNGGTYRLITNSPIVRPLEFACLTSEDSTQCFLSEIDRGPHVEYLIERFVPGSEFIQFIYKNGLQCEREGPCPPAEPPA